MEKVRRYDLDWLRVIVFSLLIFYHVGMFFVPWGWHIKNNEVYGWLRYPMLFLNQWRLPILFVISGMGTAYALSFRSAGQFIKERFIRLYIPLAVGMVLIVSPQVYMERVYDGDYSGSFLEWFASWEFINGFYPEGNFSWHHLWFLPYLLVFSIVLTPIFVQLRNKPNHSFLSWIRKRVSRNPYFLFWLILPLYLCEAFLEPFFDVTHNLVWDWFNFMSSIILFFYGFILISIKEQFWNAVGRIWKKMLVMGVMCFAALLYRWYFLEDSYIVHFTEALIKVINLWAWILTIFGWSSLNLNKKSRTIAYANRAVYPFYILHQTIIIVIGYYIYDMEWSLVIKFSVMLIGTFGLSWLLYEFLIRRVRLLWRLFGLKKTG
ncbi:acyltransferase family protein [Ekhidna sp.]